MKARTKLATLSSVLLLAACAAPTTTPNGGEPNAGPRFVSGGLDAEDYGASLGYPKGERATFLRAQSLVGSHSHLDEPIRRGSFRVSDACSRCSGSAASRSSSIRRVASSWSTPRSASRRPLGPVPANRRPCGPPPCASSEGRADQSIGRVTAIRGLAASRLQARDGSRSACRTPRGGARRMPASRRSVGGRRARRGSSPSIRSS